MTIRTTLIAALLGACVLGVPMAGATEAPRSAASEDLARDAAHLAILDRFYIASSIQDEATIAELLGSAMIWREGKGARLAGRSSDGVSGAVLEAVFGPVAARFEGFSGSASLYLPSGNQVVAMGHYGGYNRSTDDLLSAGFVHVFTFSEGRIVHLEQFTDTPLWSEDAGPD